MHVSVLTKVKFYEKDLNSTEANRPSNAINLADLCMKLNVGNSIESKFISRLSILICVGDRKSSQLLHAFVIARNRC